MKIKNIVKSTAKNKKFWGAMGLTAVSVIVILLQRKSVTVVEVEGDLVINVDDAEIEKETVNAE